ncbi:MAG: co-chaperone DjlA [Gammaproteobacteria bacterium]|nr:co-chaperone DjlA [Gammaproteobacteria bacterium]
MKPLHKWLLVGGLLGFWFGGAGITRLLGAFAGMAVAYQLHVFLTARNGTGGGFSRASTAQRRQVFFETVFLAMGHLAKVDGRVSQEEIRAARSYMHAMRLSPEAVRSAIELFTRGKDPDFPIDSQIAELAAVCGGHRALMRNFLEVLLGFALSKGTISAVERELLWRLAAGLGVSRVEMAQFEAVLRAQASFGSGGGQRQPGYTVADELEQAYKALGIESSASEREVKTAYRRLMSQHHPDKLVANGLPESMKEAAEERTHEIRKAYETIRDHRGIK